MSSASGRRLTVYVAYYQPGPTPDGDGPYVAVCNVAPDGSRPPGFSIYDDDGGLPLRNDAYCELSALHRLQVREHSPWVGLAHYRRVLVARRPPSARRSDSPGEWAVPSWDWHEVRRQGAGEDEILSAVGERDWCTAPRYDVRRAGFGSLWEQFLANHPAYLADAVDEALAHLAPCLPSFTGYLQAVRAAPLYNVFVGRRQVLDRYASFLWPVLEIVGSRAGLPENGYQRRWAGFLGERLHSYWLDVIGREEGVRIGQLPMAVLADGSLTGVAQRSRDLVTRALPPPALLGLHSALRLVRGLHHAAA